MRVCLLVALLSWRFSPKVVSDSWDLVDCSLSGSSVHGILQARILKWVAISFSKGSSWPGIEPGSPALQADNLRTELWEKPFESYTDLQSTLTWHSGYLGVLTSHALVMFMALRREIITIIQVTFQLEQNVYRTWQIDEIRTINAK